MDSDNAAATTTPPSTPPTGSSPPPTKPSSFPSSFDDSVIDKFLESNASNGDTKPAENGSTVGSDDGGFVSGEEDFEPASERPVLADPDDETLEKKLPQSEDFTHPLLGSTQLVVPSPLDDDEKVDGVGDEEDKVVVEKGSGGIGLSAILDDSVVVVADSSPVKPIETTNSIESHTPVEEPEVFVEATSNLSELGGVKDGSDEVLASSNGLAEILKLEEFQVPAIEGKVDQEEEKAGTGGEVNGDVVEELNGGDKVEEEVKRDVVEESKGDKAEEVVKSDRPEEEENSVNVTAVVPDEVVGESSSVLENGSNLSKEDELTVPVDSNVVDEDVESLTVEGGAINAEAFEPEVVEVGETEAEKDFKTKELDISVVGNGELVHEKADEIVSAESELIGTDGVNSAVEGDTGLESGGLVNAPAEVSEVVEKDGALEVVSVDDAEAEKGIDITTNEEVEIEKPEVVIEKEAASEVKQDEANGGVSADRAEIGVEEIVSEKDGVDAVGFSDETKLSSPANEAATVGPDDSDVTGQVDASPKRFSEETTATEEGGPDLVGEGGDVGGSVSDEETDGMIFGSSAAARQFIEELERGAGGGSHSGAESSHDMSQRIDGQIVTDSEEEEGESDEETDGKELFDSAALAALLKAATGADTDGGDITITSQDGSRLFSIGRPAGLGSSARSFRPATVPNRASLFAPSGLTSGGGDSDDNLSEEEKTKLEKLQALKVKFLRLVQRLGASPDESVAAQVLYRMSLLSGRRSSQTYSFDAAQKTAMQLEAGETDDLDFSLNILVIGKSGVGKSATINSIFGEQKAVIDAFEPGTTSVKEITGLVDGVKVKVFDTPGLRSAVMEQAFNNRILSSVKKLTKRSPPDIVLYVDRMDTQTRDLNDLPLLKTITTSLGQSIWRNTIVTLTHAASAPPDGPTGTPLSYEVYVSQRSHVVQQSVGQAVGDLRMMSPGLMNPVSLVENHPLCRKNREGHKVLPNGQTWRPQLLLLCYSLKILSEASSLSKPQDQFDHRKLFGLRTRAPPLPYLLSSMLHPREHPKLPSDQGIENVDSDIDLADLSDSDHEGEEDEYDQLPPFKPLRKAQLAKLSGEQKKAYFEEYDYRVKLLQKKQWREELKRMREMKKGKSTNPDDYGFAGEDGDQDNEGAAPVATPLPDMVLPPSFDSDNPAYRYRFLEPTSQFLARPVLDTHGWDHDCGYDGVNLEQTLAIASQFPAAIAVQITKDKKEFNIHLDSSVAAKHGENGSSMAGFDIQAVGKQLAYIVRGETKFKTLKKNKTTAGVSVTFLGENVATGLKIEDNIALGKQWSVAGSAGTVRCQGDAAYGANVELQRRELDYPIGQVQSTYGFSLVRWRGDWALGFNTLAQFSVGRSSKVAVRGGINNKLSGQITVRTSSSEHLAFALAGIIPVVSAIYKKIYPPVGESYSY